MKIKTIAAVLVCVLLLGLLGSVSLGEPQAVPAAAVQTPENSEGAAAPAQTPAPSPSAAPSQEPAESSLESSAGSDGPKSTEKPGSMEISLAEVRGQRYRSLAATQFEDVTAEQWYAEAVGALADQEILEAQADGLFHPDDPVTRAELLQMLGKLSGKELTAREERNTFSDVPQDSWYAPYIRWSVKEKILTGRENDTFDPDGPVSRQEMAVILYRFNKNVMGKRFPKEKATVFQDAGAISDWAALEVSAAERAGLMSGFPDGTFQPRQVITRAETAQILYQYRQKYQTYQRGCPIDELRYITHGGGVVDGVYAQSNSMEALQETYELGNRVIELDFSWTLDDELACVHNWGGSFPAQCTLENFLNTKIYGKFTPLGLEQVAQWLYGHPDVSIVMDFKERSVEGLQMIADRYPDLLDQFFPYIFQPQEYEQVRAMGYCNIMLFPVMSSWEKDFTVLAEFAREKELVAIVISSRETDLYRPAKLAGIPVIPYTVNSEESMYELSQQGADGFFTDNQDALIFW